MIINMSAHIKNYMFRDIQILRNILINGGYIVRTISAVQQKGGVGKTATIVNLGSAFYELGYNILMIDLDPQANLSSTFITDFDSINDKYIDLIFQQFFKRKELTLDKCIVEIYNNNEINRLSLVPCSIGLSYDSEVVRLKGFSQQIIQRALKSINDYDVCLIDTPPNLGILVLNAIIPSDLIIMPVSYGAMDLNSYNNFLSTLQSLEYETGKTLNYKILLNKYHPNHKIMNAKYKAFVNELSDTPQFVFNTMISQCERINQSLFLHTSIFDSDLDGLQKSRREFYQLAAEVKASLDIAIELKSKEEVI